MLGLGGAHGAVSRMHKGPQYGGTTPESPNRSQGYDSKDTAHASRLIVSAKAGENFERPVVELVEDLGIL